MVFTNTYTARSGFGYTDLTKRHLFVYLYLMWPDTITLKKDIVIPKGTVLKKYTVAKQLETFQKGPQSGFYFLDDKLVIHEDLLKKKA